MNVGIVGLGLIGGSMAKSIKARTADTVWGVDLNHETMTLARMCGAIDAPLTDENLPQCDLILIAIRPGAAIEWVNRYAPLIAKSAIVVDLCGVKRVVVGGIAPWRSSTASPTSAATPWPARSGGASPPPPTTCMWAPP